MVIYKTTNLLNGKIYIGKDTKDDPEYLGSGLYLNRAIKKYGRKNFRKDILERCLTEKELNLREKYWIKKLNSQNSKIGYNLTEGGDGGNTWRNSPSGRRARMKFLRGREKFLKSRKGKSLLRKLMLERWKDLRFREKMGKLLSNREIKWKDKISKGVKKSYIENPRGPVSEETRKKLSKAAKGKEIFKLDDTVKARIIQLYGRFGCVRIQRELAKNGWFVSKYVINRVLKSVGIYQKFKKGLK